MQKFHSACTVQPIGKIVAAKRKPWTRLDQALRATDLLLQAGGFAAIVLDLGDTAPEHGKPDSAGDMVPVSSGCRPRAMQPGGAGKAAYAQSSAAVVLECAPLHANTAGETVLRGFTFEAQRGRQRFSFSMNGARKPPASTWSACAAWEAERRA